MIHIRYENFGRRSREAFMEASLTHTSTSPHQQLMASLDLARRQVDIEGFKWSVPPTRWHWAFKQRVRSDRRISRWFRILDEAVIVPAEYGPAPRPTITATR